MKKFLLGLVGFIVVTSCSTNDEPPQVSEEKVKVQFQVSALGVDVVPISRASAKEALTQIECKIYNYSTYETTTISQTPTQDGDNFGTITAWLAPGEYNIGIIGAGNDGTGDDRNAKAVSISRSNQGHFNGCSYDKDAFGFTQSITVGNNSEVSSSVTLKRYVGKLCIQIDGVLPEVINRVEVSFDHRLWVSLSDYKSSEIEGRNEILQDLSITDGTLAEYNRYITPGEFQVKFVTYDTADKQISTITVPVNIHANKRTIIKGEAKNLLNQTPFEVSVNDIWEADVIIPLS